MHCSVCNGAEELGSVGGGQGEEERLAPGKPRKGRAEVGWCRAY